MRFFPFLAALCSHWRWREREREKEREKESGVTEGKRKRHVER